RAGARWPGRQDVRRRGARRRVRRALERRRWRRERLLLRRRREVRLGHARQIAGDATRSSLQDFRRDHHDELGLLLLRGLALEQEPEGRDVADAGDLRERLARRVVEKSRNRKGLSIAQRSEERRVGEEDS